MTVSTTAQAQRHVTVHRLAVERIVRLTDDSLAITLHVPLDLGAEYAFTQGQHVALSIPGSEDPLRRSYSICTPAGSGELTVAVKLIPGGAFSEYAHTTLAVGDELDVLTPSGSFFTPLDRTQARAYASIAAGSGITPILSIIATTLAVEEDSTFTLLYGNRTLASAMFLEELLDLKNRYPERFALYTFLSRERHDVPLLTGRIDAAKLRLMSETVLARTRFDEWFLCGPIAMVEELRATLIELGTDPARVHREVFHAGPAAETGMRNANATGSPSTVTAVLDGRTTSFEVRPDGPPILDALLAIRPDAPYACKGGVCGTCRARVVEGEVEMVSCYALELDERAAGFVLACQSHPRSPRVTLDFDS